MSTPDHILTRIRQRLDLDENDTSRDSEINAIDDLIGQNMSFRAAMKACEDCGPNAPVWIDGEPANLEAAANDALEWLKWIAPQVHGGLSAARDRCQAALEKFLIYQEDERK